MPRVQAIVIRDQHILLVKHRLDGKEWWCLPGGGLEADETLEEGALRELREECNVTGKLIRQTGFVHDIDGGDTYSFLVDIADQTPSLGYDPEFLPGQQVIIDVQWLRLCNVPERDRVYLWQAGLLGVGDFLAEVEEWGNATSYPGNK